METKWGQAESESTAEPSNPAGRMARWGVLVLLWWWFSSLERCLWSLTAVSRRVHQDGLWMLPSRQTCLSPLPLRGRKNKPAVVVIVTHWAAAWSAKPNNGSCLGEVAEWQQKKKKKPQRTRDRHVCKMSAVGSLILKRRLWALCHEQLTNGSIIQH